MMQMIAFRHAGSDTAGLGAADPRVSLSISSTANFLWRLRPENMNQGQERTGYALLSSVPSQHVMCTLQTSNVCKRHLTRGHRCSPPASAMLTILVRTVSVSACLLQAASRNQAPLPPAFSVTVKEGYVQLNP